MAHMTLATVDPLPGEAARHLDPALVSGFSNFLGPPDSAQRGTLGETFATARADLARLVHALPVAFVPETQTSRPHPVWGTSTLVPGVNADDNPFIPSGYTYLLQYIAHDLVNTAVPFWAAADAGVGSRNLRGGLGLQLDTLYGGGPMACPLAFVPAGRNAGQRTLLRLGQSAGGCPFRDLARVNVANGLPKAHDSYDSINFDLANQAQIADARNDDNILLSQITVLLSVAHNAIVKAMAPGQPEAMFGHARDIMLMMYYNIITEDLLSQLLHPAIYAALKDRPADGPDWLWLSDDIPLEFTHGAFRVGHAMVRGHYRLNDRFPDKVDITQVVNGNQSIPDARHPMMDAWIVQWSNFFKMHDGKEPNYSRRIGPTQSRLDHDVLFENIGLPGSDGISIRDNLSAAMAHMWTVDALIAGINKRNPGLIPANWPLATAAGRATVIDPWLKRYLPDGLASFHGDPPLPLFILLEAAFDPNIQGRSMGVLGSIIIGEVIFKRIAIERKRLMLTLPNAKALLPDEIGNAADTVSTMPDLVRFAETHGESSHGGPPFV